MSDAPFDFAGTAMIATLSGALVLPEHATVVVSDLHLEKGSSLARRGALLPPYDSRATLALLADTLERYRPQRVVCLGDSFHDGSAPGRLSASDRTGLAALMGGREWVWIVGNHDREPAPGLGGEVAAEFHVAGLVLRHEARRGEVSGEVSGHYHPKATIRTGPRRISAPCFVGDGRRLILPAFGAYTGGLDIRDPEIAQLFEARVRAWILGRSRVHAMPLDLARRTRSPSGRD